MAYLGSTPNYGFLEGQTVTFNGSTTQVTLNRAISTPDAIDVFIDNVHQEPDVAYTVDAGGGSITFTGTPVNGAVCYIRFHGQKFDTAQASQVIDSDGDTHVKVEASSDSDTVVVTAGGTVAITANSSGVTIPNLTVTGTTTSVNSTNLNIGDNQITLNSDVTGTPSENAGLIVNRGSASDVSFLWNETSDYWIVNEPLVSATRINAIVSGNTPSLDGDNIGLFQNSASSQNAIVSIISNSSSYSQLNFGDENDENAGYLRYNNSSDLFTLNSPITISGNATFDSEVFISEKLTHTGDTDTHLRFAGANDIRIVAGNVEHAAFDGTVVFNQSGADMDFRVESSGNANMLFVDSGNNRVGIGTNSPIDLFSVKGASGASTDISFSGGDDTNDIRLFFGGSSSPFNGSINYEPDTNNMHFKTSGIERMRIHNGNAVSIGTTTNAGPLFIKCATDDNIRFKQETHASIGAVNDAVNAFVALKIDGNDLLLNSQSGANVMIGQTSNDAHLNSASGDGLSISASGEIFQGTTGESMILNRRGSDGNIIRLRKDGSTIGLIGVTSSDQLFLTRATGSQGIKLKNSALMPSNANGSDSDNDQDLGSSSVRWKDLYLSNAVYTTYVKGGSGHTGQMHFTGSHDIRFVNNGNERMRIDSSGKVGIGTSSPAQILEVNGSSPKIRVSTSSGNTSARGIEFDNNGTLVTGSLLSTGLTGETCLASGSSGGSGFYLTFKQDNTERMRINSNGKILVNATNATTGGFNPQMLIKQGADSGFISGLNIEGQTADAVLGIGYKSGSGAFEIASSYRSSAGYKPIDFATTGATRMRLDTSGSLLLSTTAQYNAKLNIVFNGSGASPQGDYRGITLTPTATNSTTYLHFHNTGASTLGSITGNGSNIAFNTSSDYRIKDNIVNLTDATTRLKQLQPRRFNLLDNAEKTIDGFIAHEVSGIVPEAVFGDKDEVDKDGKPVIQQLDQSKLIPLLTKTIQELEARITALENA